MSKKKEIIAQCTYDDRGLLIKVERTDEEIVRCKDCLDFRHCLHNEYNDPNGYCAWGKKEDAKEE